MKRGGGTAMQPFIPDIISEGTGRVDTDRIEMSRL
jgi:hypothetical protein